MSLELKEDSLNAYSSWISAFFLSHVYDSSLSNPRSLSRVLMVYRSYLPILIVSTFSPSLSSSKRGSPSERYVFNYGYLTLSSSRNFFIYGKF